MIISRDEIGVIYRHAREEDINELGPWLLITMDKYRINKPLRMAHFLTQVGHESGELRYREELASGAAYEGRLDLGNTHRGDGRRFKGHGLIQCTGRENHEAYDEFRGLDGLLLEKPYLIATDPEMCCDVAGWYWDKKELNQLADLDALRSITRRVNGGLNGLRDRQRLLYAAKGVLLRGANEQPIIELQRVLNQLDKAGLAVDGVNGPATRTAVRHFQRGHGLIADGVAGPKTWAKLHEQASG